MFADRPSHPTLSCSSNPLVSVGDRSPNAESETLKEPSSLHDSLRGVGDTGLSIGLTTAFCLGTVADAPLLAGVAAEGSDHLKMVGNWVTSRPNSWNFEFHPAPWTRVILSRMPLKGDN